MNSVDKNNIAYFNLLEVVLKYLLMCVATPLVFYCGGRSRFHVFLRTLRSQLEDCQKKKKVASAYANA